MFENEVNETVDEALGREPKLSAADHEPQPGDDDYEPDVYDLAPHFKLAHFEDDEDLEAGLVTAELARDAIEYAQEHWHDPDFTDEERYEAYGLVRMLNQAAAEEEDAIHQSTVEDLDSMEQLGYNTDVLAELTERYDGDLETALEVFEQVGPTHVHPDEADLGVAISGWQKEQRAIREAPSPARTAMTISAPLLPRELLELPRWLAWKYEHTERRPVTEVGDYEPARALVDAGEANGTAFLLEAEDPYTCVILSGAIRKGEIVDKIVPVVERLSTYMEADPTRRNLVLILKARLPDPVRIVSTPWGGSLLAFGSGWVPLSGGSPWVEVLGSVLKAQPRQRELDEIVRELRG
jgi:hypothetical protein